IVSVTVAEPLALPVLAVIQLCELTTTHEHPDASLMVMLRDPPLDATDAVLLSETVSQSNRIRHMFAVAVPPARADHKYRFCASALTDGWLSIPPVLTAPKFFAGPNVPPAVSRFATHTSAPP